MVDLSSGAASEKSLKGPMPRNLNFKSQIIIPDQDMDCKSWTLYPKHITSVKFAP